MTDAALVPEIVSPAATAAGPLPVLKGHLLDFLNRSPSADTRDTYRRAVLEFHRFASLHLMAATSADVLAWRDDLTARGRSDSTVVAKLAALRSFYDYLAKLYPGLLPVNPADTQLVPPPRLSDEPKGRALRPKEVQMLLAGPDRATASGARDYALMLVMLRLSLRVSEAARLRASAMQWRGEGWQLRLKVKGGREEVWPLPLDVKQAVDEYLRLDAPRRSLWPETRTGDQYVFQPEQNNRTGVYSRPLSRQHVARIVKRWADYGGIRGKVTPHDLRRTAVTRALEQGRSYREVQMMSKHRDPKTVMRYDRARENLERNPVNTLSYDD